MGCGGTGGSLPGLLPLDASHPDLKSIFRSGDIEDDYDVEKEPIARGKFASVRLARHRRTKDIYAAKFIRRRRRAANLEDEARHEVAVLLLGRSAPHIVQLHQVYETRTEYIIILEFGAGGDLQRLLDDQGRLLEKTVKKLLYQLLKGLGFLHKKRIAHLDIKPQNLVLMSHCTETGLRMVDFGLSRVIYEDAELTQIMGTPDYVAPEVINFEAVGLATDMWSVGVLTYVLLTGYTPFGGDTDQETFVNITQGDFDFPEEYFSDVSEQAKDFISGLLIKIPSQRMSVDQCFTHPWMCDLCEPHRLSQLSEADSADSGYSTDQFNGSPPSPDAFGNGYASEFYQCSIPEDSPLPTYQQQHMYQLHLSRRKFEPHYLHKLREGEVDSGVIKGERRHRMPSSAHLSINVLECLQQEQRPQLRPLRRSSLVIPKYSDGQKDTTFDDTSDSSARQPHNSLYNSGYLGHTNSTSNLPWSNNSHLGLNSSYENQCDYNTLLNITKPWKNLCNGSYTRALNQLNTKSSPKNRHRRTNLGLHPELSCSMFELQPRYDNYHHLQTDVRETKSDLRKSKGDLRTSKNDLKSPKEVQKFLVQESRPSKYCLRGSQSNLAGKVAVPCSKLDFRSSKTDLRGSKTDVRGSKHELRGSKSDLRVYKTDYSNLQDDLHTTRKKPSINPEMIAQLNMSLSRLDLSCKSSDKNEDSEERDVVYSDCTLPRRFSRPTMSSLMHGNSFHMSFRRTKKRDGQL